jgi:hypothetical protein
MKRLFMRLGDLVQLDVGSPIRGALRPDAEGNVHVVQLRDVAGGLLNWKNVVRTNLPSVRERYWLKSSDILFTPVGQRLSACVVGIDVPLGKAVAGQHLYRLRADDVGKQAATAVDSRFLAWLLNQPVIQTQLTQMATGTSQLNIRVWNACDTFRGTVDPSIYKDYVLTMLFLKYISDVWQDHYDGYKAEHGDHPELIEELLKNERFVLPPGANFYALHERAPSRATASASTRPCTPSRKPTAPSCAKSVFQDISFNTNKLGDEAQKNDILRHLLEDFAKPELNLRPAASAPWT